MSRTIMVTAYHYIMKNKKGMNPGSNFELHSAIIEVLLSLMFHLQILFESRAGDFSCHGKCHFSPFNDKH